MFKSNYYGTGFYIILTPIYCLTDNATIIRQFTLGFVVLLVSYQAVICYKIMVCYLNIENKRFAQFLSIGLSFLPVVRSNMALNEPPLEFIMWVVLYFLLTNLNQLQKKKIYINSILIGMLLGYSRTIHERALTFIVATVITICFFHLVFKKKSVNYIFFCSSLAISIIFSKMYNLFSHNVLWGGQEVTNTVDASAAKSLNAIVLLFSDNGVRAALNIILGEIFTANIYTCGLFILGILLFFRLSFQFIKKGIRTNEMQYSNEYYIIFIFSLCIYATLGVMALQFLNGAIIAYNDSIAARSYCYLRYFFIYYPPICMVSILLLFKRKIGRKLIYLSIILMSLLSKYVILYFKPVIIRNPSLTLDRFHYLSPFSLRKPDEMLTLGQLASCIVVCFIIYLIILCCIRKNKVIISICIIMCVFVYEYLYSIFGYSSYFMHSYYGYVNSFYEEIYQDSILENVNLVYVATPNASYMAASEMMDLDIRKGFPDSITEGEVILTMKVKKGIEKIGVLYLVQLDENEYLYFSDLILRERLEKKGYEIVFLGK